MTLKLVLLCGPKNALETSSMHSSTPWPSVRLPCKPGTYAQEAFMVCDQKKLRTPQTKDNSTPQETLKFSSHVGKWKQQNTVFNCVNFKQTSLDTLSEFETLLETWGIYRARHTCFVLCPKQRLRKQKENMARIVTLAMVIINQSA